MNLPINKIVCGNNVDVLKTFPSNCIDLILTDPPYGLDIAKTGCLSIEGASKAQNLFVPSKWDKRPNKEIFNEILRVAENQIIWGGNYFTDYLKPSQCWLVWWKKDGLPRGTFADCELAWTSFDMPAQVFNSRWHGFIRDSKDIKQSHPTQKALSIMKWCIELFSRPNDIILDPFVGSGTTCLAAKELNRKYIGIDISKEYCEMSEKRLTFDEDINNLALSLKSSDFDDLLI